MHYKISHSLVCEKGLVRQINQDAVFADSDGRNGVFCVADGMGGHSNGEIASKIIVSEIHKAYLQVQDTFNVSQFKDIFNLYKNALDKANRIIFEEYNNDSVCGSTVSLLIIFDSYYGIINIGDSRIYIFQNNHYFKATEDDIWDNLAEQKGVDKRILSSSSNYGMLTNSVGTSEKMNISYTINTIRDKMNFLLCSDGVYKYCDEVKLFKALKKYKNDPQNVSRLLSEEVYENGAFDNFSIICVSIK